MHVLALALASFLSQSALGQPPGENLQFHVPDGFKMDFQAQQKNVILVEYVPQAESVKNWTEMVTVQVVLGSRTTLEQVLASLQAQPPQGCKDHKVAILGKGQENGYAFLSWSVFCSQTAVTGKPEFSWFKAIRGNDSLYVVFKSFKSEPPQEKVADWNQHMQGIIVCDTRLADRACPNPSKAKPQSP